MGFQRLELLRDSASTAYAAFSEKEKYFLRIVKPPLADSAKTGTEVQVYLQERGFPVPPVCRTRDGAAYVCWEEGLIVLYEFVEGEDSQPERDMEEIGALVGRLHREMGGYPGHLVRRDRQFYIGRYVDFLREKRHPRAQAYGEYGACLWKTLEALPMGFCHGDMYCGNIRRARDGRLYIHDFDTSCIGFPMYDAALICDATEYFQYDPANLARSDRLLERFRPGYGRYAQLTQGELEAFHGLIALQHFSTQATMVEVFGPDCLSNADIEAQFQWLCRWRDQCKSF